MTLFAINDSDRSRQNSDLGTTQMHASAQIPPPCKGSGSEAI